MFQITVDGQRGAGKTTVARNVARKLGILFYDTDVVCLTISLLCFQKGVNPTDSDEVQNVLKGVDITLKDNGVKTFAFINGVNVTNMLSHNIVQQNQFVVGNHKCVKDFIINQIKKLSENQSIVVDVIGASEKLFPYAKYKFFLKADVYKRAERRYENALRAGLTKSFEDVFNETMDFDQQMFSGSAINLKISQDQYVIDTTNVSLNEVTNQICAIVNK